MDQVVLDTNVFVAAGFNPGSDAAEVLRRVREGRLRMAWNEATRGEIERIVRKIPPLSNAVLEGVFLDAERGPANTGAERYGFVPDPEDRKFAALAEAVGAVLVTLDAHLLDVRDRLGVPVLRPGDLACEECEA
jgi:predicted nucleic acid-binding protein